MFLINQLSHLGCRVVLSDSCTHGYCTYLDFLNGNSKDKQEMEPGNNNV
jgi:hypothetical protein